MALPERLESVSTNLPISHLSKIAGLLESRDDVEWVPGSISAIGEGASGKFKVDGATDSLDECYETVRSIKLVAANPDFVKGLIDELEVQLSPVVEERDYDKAKIINGRIKSLTMVRDLKGQMSPDIF